MLKSDFANMSGNSAAASGPGRGSALVTPSDTVPLSEIARQLYITGAGDVKFTCFDGTVDTRTMPANSYLDVAVVLVWATGTTATGIHATW